MEREKIFADRENVLPRNKPTLSKLKLICEVIGSAFIDEIGENSPLAELSSLPLLLNDFWNDYLKKLFGIVGTRVLVCGDNINGQLGLGDKQNRYSPKTISVLGEIKITQIACGSFHTLLLCESGKVLGCGYNLSGQLGLSDRLDRSYPNEITALKGKQVVAIACGSDHSMFLTQNEGIFSCGNDSCGQLGMGDLIGRYEPTQIKETKNMTISNIFAFETQNFALLENDEIWGWGKNGIGQIGIGNFMEIIGSPQKVVSLSRKGVSMINGSSFQTFALTGNGEILYSGNKNSEYSETGNANTFQIFTELSGKNIISISCGNAHFLALQDDGKIYSWGQNRFGQLGISEKEVRTPTLIKSFIGKQVISISSGYFFNIAQLASGELYSWGRNESGQLLLGHTENKQFPYLIPQMEDKKILQIVCGSYFAILLIR